MMENKHQQCKHCLLNMLAKRSIHEKQTCALSPSYLNSQVNGSSENLSRTYNMKASTWAFSP